MNFIGQIGYGSCCLSDKAHSSLGRIKTHIALQPASQIEQDHACSRSDLEDVERSIIAAEDCVHRITQPLTHFALVDVASIVHGSPANEVSPYGLCLYFVDRLVGVFIEKPFPYANL